MQVGRREVSGDEIVEHHELHRLVEQHDALAHWPIPIRPTVEAVLDKLAARLDPTKPTETRTLGEMHAAIAALDPGARLRDLTSQLVALNDRLHLVEADRGAETNPTRAALLVAEQETLRASQKDARALISTEREAVNRRTYTPTDEDALRSALARRTETIYQQAVIDRPEWLVDLLTELDDRGTLTQLRPGQVRQRVLDRAIAGDLVVDRLAPAAQRKGVRALERSV